MIGKIVLIYVAVFLLVALAHKYRRSWWGQELLRPYGVRSKRRFAQPTKADYFRTAVIAALLAVVLLTAAAALSRLADRHPVSSPAHDLYMTYVFAGVFVAALAGVSAVLVAIRGLFHRAPSLLPYTISSHGQVVGRTRLEYEFPENRSVAGTLIPTEAYVNIERDFAAVGRGLISRDEQIAATVKETLEGLAVRHGLKLESDGEEIPTEAIFFLDLSPADYASEIEVHVTLAPEVAWRWAGSEQVDSSSSTNGA